MYTNTYIYRRERTNNPIWFGVCEFACDLILEPEIVSTKENTDI